MAYEQGYLTSKKINRIQKWALAYHIVSRRRMSREILEQATRELQQFVNPSLYERVFVAPKDIEESGVEFEAGDIDRAEAFLRRLESGKTLTMTERTLGEWV